MATAPGSGDALSKEQAAEEARRAYARYQAAIDRVYQSGGKNASLEFSKVATDGELEHLEHQASVISKAGWRQVGGVTIRDTKVSGVEVVGEQAKVNLIVCLDTSKRRAVDAKGKDVTRKTARYFLNYALVLGGQSSAWLVAEEKSSEAKAC